MDSSQQRLLTEDGVIDGEQDFPLIPGFMGHITAAVGAMQARPAIALKFALEHETQIQSLRRQLEEKDEEIASLQKKLQVIQLKNNDLQIKLVTKDTEVKQLQERIQALEDEKKNLEDELSQVENKLKRLEQEMGKLNKTTKQHEEENRKLKESLQKVEFDLCSTRETLTSENEKLKKEVKILKETKPMPPVDYSHLALQQAPANENSVAMLHLGELCWQLQGSMYEKVLPNHYVSVLKYKIKDIEKDVKKLPATEEEKAAAEKRFEELKQNVKWDDDLKDTIETLQKTRNNEAHPSINEASLKRYVQFLEKNGCLKGRLSKEKLNELIQIWKRLKSQ